MGGGGFVRAAERAIGEASCWVWAAMARRRRMEVAGSRIGGRRGGGRRILRGMTCLCLRLLLELTCWRVFNSYVELWLLIL